MLKSIPLFVYVKLTGGGFRTEKVILHKMNQNSLMDCRISKTTRIECGVGWVTFKCVGICLQDCNKNILFLCCRKYLPILKNFPSKYIYEPWTASEEEQKQAGCIIGSSDTVLRIFLLIIVKKIITGVKWKCHTSTTSPAFINGFTQQPAFCKCISLV